MKNGKKRLLIAGCALSLLGGMTQTALGAAVIHVGDTRQAAVWTKDIGGRWYYLDEYGKPVKNKWVGNYYLGEDGVMLTDTRTPDGYWVGTDGAWDGRPAEVIYSEANVYEQYLYLIGWQAFETRKYRVLYSVQDVNGDGVEELLYQEDFGGQEPTRFHLCTLVNGQVLEQNFQSAGLLRLQTIVWTEYDFGAAKVKYTGAS